MNDTAGQARRTLDPKLDIVFWMLFGAEQNRGLHAEPERLGVDDKGIALDVRVRLVNGEQVDVEMQSQRHLALRERALYYWARLYAGQLQRGSAYVELQRCAVVLIANFVELEGARFHSTFKVREPTSGAVLTEHFELHVLELPKLPSALDRNDEPSLVLWGRFLAATRDEDLEQLAMESPVLKQAKDALDRLSADPDARLRAEQREMALISYELGMTTARRQGEAAGRLEGKAELLQRQLTLKFGELPADVVTRLASATEADLARWSERILSASSLDQVL